MSALWRIMALWRGRSGWLALGVVMSLGALIAGVGLMTLSGGLVAGGGALVYAGSIQRITSGRVIPHSSEFASMRGIERNGRFRALEPTSICVRRSLY